LATPQPGFPNAFGGNDAPSQVVLFRGNKKKSPNGSNQALKHSHCLLFLGDFWYPVGQRLGEPQTVMKGIVYGVKRNAKRRQMQCSGWPPIFMNGGGNSVDKSLCPDSFGLDLPLHV